METKNFQLKVPSELWQKFKAKTTKDITLNEKLLELIRGYCND